MFSFPLRQVTHRAFRAWQRNTDTFLRLWKTEGWPPFIDPLLYIVSLGFGLGAYVEQINGLSYLEFIAPAFAMTAGMFTASFECTYGAFIRMEYQKTFDAMLATPLSIEDVIAGDILFGATRAVFASFAVLVIISLFGLIDPIMILASLPIAFLSGVMFSALAEIFTAIAPSINSFNYYITMGLTPMFVFSGVFFPIDQYPDFLQNFAWFIPLYHAVNLQRSLAAGDFSLALWIDVIWMIVVAVIATHIALVLMRRRLIK